MASGIVHGHIRTTTTTKLRNMVAIPQVPRGLLEVLGGGMRPASQTTYPIYHQNLGFSLLQYDLTENSIPRHSCLIA